MHHEYTPVEEIANRLQALRAAVAAQGWDAALIVQDVDLFYFSGTMQNALLFCPRAGDVLMMVKKYQERARRESAVEHVVPLSSWKELPALITKHHGALPKTIGVELDVLPAKDYLRLQRIFAGVTIVDSAPAIQQIRRIKFPYEIDLMKKAGEIGKAVYAAVPRVLRQGMTEIELAGIMVAEAMAHGHQNYLRMRAFNSYAFSWHVLSGPAGGELSFIDAPMGGIGLSPSFPVGASQKKIVPHEPILIDFGICYHGYQIDETRMFCLGKIPQEFKAAYEAARRIEAAITTAARPGASCQKLYEKGWQTARALGYEESFMGPPGYKTRFIGHGIGLEIGEFPFIAEGHDYPLEEGMTFAVEPKMVFPGKGAVGIENTFCVTEQGVEQLTTADERLIEI
jgi:Xaa-Pro dipeptidase